MLPRRLAAGLCTPPEPPPAPLTDLLELLPPPLRSLATRAARRLARRVSLLLLLLLLRQLCGVLLHHLRGVLCRGLRLRDLSPHEKQAFLQTSMCTCLSEKFLPFQPSPPSTSSFQPLLPLLNSIFTPLILVLQTTRHCSFLFPDTLTVQKKRRQALASSWNPRQWPLRRLHDVCTNRKTKRKCLYRVAKNVSSLSYRSFPANGD